MNSVTNRAFMAKKKMYKKPITEVNAFETEYMMQDAVVSINQGTDPHPTAGAPSRGGIIE